MNESIEVIDDVGGGYEQVKERLEEGSAGDTAGYVLNLTEGEGVQSRMVKEGMTRQAKIQKERRATKV